MGDKAVTLCASLLIGVVFALIFGAAAFVSDESINVKVFIVIAGLLIGIGIVFIAVGSLRLLEWAERL